MIEPKLKCEACVWYDEENHRCNLLKGLLKGNHEESTLVKLNAVIYDDYSPCKLLELLEKDYERE